MATGYRSAALGHSAQATHANATAIGTGARTTRDNQVSIGTQSSTYTMSGSTSGESRSRQSEPTYFVTTDNNGNLATTTYSMSSLERRLDKQGDGIALAMAMGGVFLPGNKNFALSINTGHYDGNTAFAASGAANLGDN